MEIARHTPGRLEEKKMKINQKHLSMHAIVTAGLVGLLMASVVACGDMVSHRGEIVITPGSEQQVAEALRVKPSKLNRLKPDRKLAKKIKDRLNNSLSGTVSHADEEDDDNGGGTVDIGGEECPTAETIEEIPCDDVASAAGLMSTDSATDGPACTCTAKSWCEKESDGACMCYTEVSNCG